MVWELVSCFGEKFSGRVISIKKQKVEIKLSNGITCEVIKWSGRPYGSKNIYTVSEENLSNFIAFFNTVEEI